MVDVADSPALGEIADAVGRQLQKALDSLTQG
jgi:hypothetical protein